MLPIYEELEIIYILISLDNKFERMVELNVRKRKRATLLVFLVKDKDSYSIP